MSFEETSEKLLALMDSYARKDCVIAFSGGVDSSLLLKLACESAASYGTKVYAVMICSELAPVRDYDIARNVAAQTGAVFESLNIHELDQPQIKNNAPDRCYICKKYLFTRLLEFAGTKGIDTVLEGTNADDLHVYRPGIRAIKELGIQSPLAAVGMTKAQVRRMAASYGISVAHRPSSPCMATRFPYGTTLDIRELRKAEEGEAILQEMGFDCVRLRVHGNIARIEVPADKMQELLSRASQMVQKIKDLGYDYVTMDLEGFRSGSMDIHL